MEHSHTLQERAIDMVRDIGETAYGVGEMVMSGIAHAAIEVKDEVVHAAEVAKDYVIDKLDQVEEKVESSLSPLMDEPFMFEENQE
jgi:hypothetical protein